MILVLGGAGYIGSHTVKHLKSRGEKVLVYDDLSQGHARAVPGVEIVQGDVNDRARLAEVCRTRSVEAVMHFAAFCYVGESVLRPDKYYWNNVAGMVNVLDAMQEGGVKRIIFSSSAAVYGVPAMTPITEEAPRAPINPYGRTKLMMEEMMEDYARAFGMAYAALRYFNAAGADTEGVLGEWHVPETHLIPLAVRAALGRRETLTIYGDGFPTPDGTCIRDYIHVDDLAKAHALALDRLRHGGGSGAWNLGNGQGFSVKEVVDTVRNVSGRDFRVEIGPPRPGDPPVLVADAARAATELGWRPRHPSLEEIVSTAYRWLETHPEGYGT